MLKPLFHGFCIIWDEMAQGDSADARSLNAYYVQLEQL
jgi:hypothetical protein